MSSISYPFFVILRMMTPSSVSTLQCLRFCCVFLSCFLSCHSWINFQWCREAREETYTHGETWCVLKALLFIRAVYLKVSHKVCQALPFLKKNWFCAISLFNFQCKIVFLTLTLCTRHACPVAQKAPHPNNCTPMVFFLVVRCLLFMVTL
jgi:hypothetical protein